MEKVPASVKEFSKEYAPEERKKVAGEIRTRRGEYFQRKESLAAQIHDLTERMEERQENLGDIVQEIKDLENELGRWKEAVIQRVLHHFQIPKHEKKIHEKSEIQGAFESEYEHMRADAEELHQQSADKSELDETRDILKNFYGEQWAAYEKDRQIRDIGNVTRQYEATFVHGIHPKYIPQVNSLLNEWVDWKMKLKILLALGPTISSSTMRKGESGEGLWARMGVILSGGSIQTADIRDAGSRAQGLKKRIGWSNQRDIQKRIRQAVTEKHLDRYNEFAVQDSEIAGFFVNTDEILRLQRSNLAPVSEIIPFIKELDMPLYAMHEGEVYETEYDETGTNFIMKDKISPSEITTRRFQLDPVRKEKLFEEILADSPFKITSPEVGYIHSKAQGRETYVEINVPKHLEMFHGADKAYELGAGERDTYSLAGKQVRVVAEFSEIGSRVAYLVYKGHFYRRREDIHTHEISLYPIRAFDAELLGYISIGFSTHNLGRPVTSSEAYFSGMEESIKKLKQEREQYTDRKDVLKIHDEWMSRLAFHLYGFGEQAETLGDIGVKEKAFALAEEIVGQDAYREITERRIDEQGHFKIEMRDLA